MASDPDLPKLQFEPFTHLVCPRHGEPFRREYPSGGFVTFTMLLMKAAFENEELQREAGAGEDGWEGRVMAALAERPACERASTDVLKRLYRTCREPGKPWPFGVCEVCRLAKAGSPYGVSLLPGRKGPTKEYSHLCFDCVVDRLTPISPDDR